MPRDRKSSSKTGHKDKGWLASQRKDAAAQRANLFKEKQREKRIRGLRRRQQKEDAKKSKIMEREFLRTLNPNERKVALVLKDFLTE